MLKILKNYSKNQHFALTDNFFSLDDFSVLPTGNFEIEARVHFKINAQKFLSDGAKLIKLSVINDNVKSLNPTSTIQTSTPTIANVLKYSKARLQYGQVADNTSTFLFEKSFAAFNFIDKTQLGSIAVGFNPIKTLTTIARKPVSTIKEGQENPPLAIFDESNSSNFNIDSMLLAGIDPSYVTQTRNLFSSVADTFLKEGFKKANDSNFRDLNAYASSIITLSGIVKNIQQLKETDAVSVFESSFSSTNFIDAVEKIKIEVPKDSLSDGAVSLQLSSEDETGNQISLLSSKLKLFSMASEFLTPKISPRVSHARNGSKINFLISAGDKQTKGIHVYEKSIHRLSPDKYRRFNFLKTILFENSNDVNFQVDDGVFFNNDLKGVTRIYRFIPFGLNLLNERIETNIFNNVVINNFYSNFGKFVPIICESTQEGVVIEHGNLPEDAIGFLISRRTVDFVGGKFIPIQDLNSSNNPNLSLDASAVVGKTYEYKLEIQYSSGEITTASSTLITHTPPINGLGINPFSISEPSVSIQSETNIPDVSFSLSFLFTKSEYELLRDALQNRGITQFNALLQENFDNLGDVISYQVKRTDMATGEIFTFRHFTGTNFSDIESCNRDNVPFLRTGRSYKYEVRIFVRDPRTTVKNYVVEATGSSGITYSYSPNKFMNPYSLNNGILLTDDYSLITSKNFMEFGDIGIFKTLMISTPQITTAAANFEHVVKNIKSNMDLITWSYSSPNQVDHFIIVRKVDNEKFIDAVVANNSKNNVSFYNVLPNSDDTRPRRYEIFAVGVDYSITKLT